MTRKQLSDRVQNWFGLQSIDDFDEVPLIHDLIYRGTIDLLTRTRCVARCVQLNTTAGVDTYTLDHKIISLVDVENGATRRARRNQPYRRGLVGTVVYPDGADPYVGTPLFTLIRSDVLRLDPTPSEDGTVQVWAVLLPAQMVDDDDSPGDEAYGAIPEEFQDTILTYCFWQAADYGDDGSSKKGELYRVQYEGSDGRSGRLMQIRSLVNKRGTARAPDRAVSLSGGGSRGAWIG